MNQCITVFDAILPNQRAIVVISRGDKFTFDNYGTGETGNWLVDPNKIKMIEKVLVYLRKPGESGGRIYIGEYTGYRPSDEKGRTIITFSKLIEVCQTKSNWYKFAQTGPNPVRFIN